MNCERPYYRESDCRPLLYYAVFGVSDEELKVSREAHHVDEFPEGLNFVICDRNSNGDYMQSLLGGSLGRILDRQRHELYSQVRDMERWAVISGGVRQDDTLRYMQNVIGFIQALLETGAAGVLDLQTFSLYSSREWTDTFFEQEFNPCRHAVILSSADADGGFWLHTRGMRKFGRPDISMENVPEGEIGAAASVINQMIYYGSLGAFFDRETKLHVQSGHAYLVKPQLVNDYENPDFNNAYYRLMWQECEQTG